ncbi:MAG: hypothetical protein JWM85_2116 [Acidimicrobiaceae bacterium]|nr:hypothetical protein [Acidimicrobiaceae bacterium]
MQLFGRQAETPEQREVRERDEEQRRKNRDAAPNAIAAKLRAEEERRYATASAMPVPRQYPPGRSPEDVEARREEARVRLEDSKVLQARADAWRRTVADATTSAQRDEEAAAAGHDLDAYAAAYGRHQALRKLLGQLDEAERTRRQIAAQPIIHGSERI